MMGATTALAVITGKNCGKGRDERRHAGEGHNGSGGSKKDDECCQCGKKGHWARECQKKKREEGHLAKINDDADPALLFALDDTPASVTLATTVPSATTPAVCRIRTRGGLPQ
jgi:hypothetical protein